MCELQNESQIVNGEQHLCGRASEAAGERGEVTVTHIL